jgi:hypothetical protein
MDILSKPTKYRNAGFWVVVGLSFLIGSSCGEPNPLYGTWADNRGNNLSFLDDGTFTARINGPANGANPVSTDYNGKYFLLLNSLLLECDEIELKIVTEWDIRGNILYLDWVTADSNTFPLTLFKIAN